MLVKSIISIKIPKVLFSGADLGAEAVGDRLVKSGWLAAVIPARAAKMLEIRNLRKRKFGTTTIPPETVPFEHNEGVGAVAAAAKSVGVYVGAFKEWVVIAGEQVKKVATTVVNPVGAAAEVGATAGGYLGEKKKELDECRGSIVCKLELLGIPKAAQAVIAVVGGIFLLVQIANVKRTFLGGADVRYDRPRRRKAKRVQVFGLESPAVTRAEPAFFASGLRSRRLQRSREQAVRFRHKAQKQQNERIARGRTRT